MPASAMLLVTVFMISTWVSVAEAASHKNSFCKIDQDFSRCPKRPLPLHNKVCCLVNNVGKTIHMKENNQLNIVICPAIQPRNCPSISIYNYYAVFIYHCYVVYESCTHWLKEGYNLNGVYYIRNIEQTKTEVSFMLIQCTCNSMSLILFCY